nr:capsid protein [Pterostylis totivirus]
MDSFVRRFFPEFRAPGMPFVMGDNCSLTTYYSGILTVLTQNSAQNREYVANQPMTPAGMADLCLEGGISSLDGLNRQVLNPEGSVNMESLGIMLKTASGLQTAVWSAHMAAANTWEWADNHTTLLFNMLRFCFMRQWTKGSGNLNVALGEYDDGHVKISRDQWWPDTYPANNDWDWPGGIDSENYPTFRRLIDPVPDDGRCCVDLRGLSSTGARFVLLMLGAWRRRSRYRVDMETPMLVEHVYYRSHGVVDSLDSWMAENHIRPVGAVVPPLPTAEEAWEYLRMYITQNRLFDHFSTALYMMCCLAYQFVPVTAEGNYWLSLTWKASLPQFRSIRGRYVCLNEGISALVSHRALAEWGFINGKMEKLNLMALVFGQAAQTGMAIRSTRRGMEDDPQDLYQTNPCIRRPSEFFAASVAEATRCAVPMSGMESVYVYLQEDFDVYDERRRVLTMNRTDDAGLQSYCWVARRARALVPQKQSMVLLEADYRRAKATDGVTADQVVLPQPVTWTLVKEVPAPMFFFAEEDMPPVEGVVLMAELVVGYIPLAGNPVLIVPITPCKYPTPLGLSGTINKKTFGQQGRVALKLNWPQVWELSNLVRVCGYDTELIDDNAFAGPRRVFAPNDVNMVWPLLRKPESQWLEASVTDMVRRFHHFIRLPNLMEKFFDGEVVYRVQVHNRGCGRAAHQGSVNVRDHGGVANLSGMATVSYTVPEGIERLRGYVTRDETDFRFAPYVQVGEIPLPNQHQTAPTAVDP